MAATSLISLTVTAPSAAAVTPPVAMTADDMPTWQTNGVVWAMAQSDGQVFAGGTFSAVRPPGAAAGTSEQSALNFVALDAATGDPTDCKLSFTIGSGTATVRALATSPDGATLYAGGDFGAVNGVSRSRLAAIDIASCSVKTGFNAGSISAPVRAIKATADTVYFGGDFKTVSGQSRGRFAAVSTTGALKAWNPDADLTGRAIEVTPSGDAVALGGDFNTVGGRSSHALAIVNPTSGAVIKNYTPASGNVPGHIAPTSVVKGLAVDANGIYTGNEGTGGGVFDGRLSVNLTDFTERWRDTCLGATQALTVYKTVLYSVSHAHNCSSMGQFGELHERQHMLAESVHNPKPLLSWFPDTDDGPSGTEQIGPRTIVSSTKGGKDYMWVGGEFTRIQSNGNKLQQGLVHFPAGPDTRAPSAGATSVTAANVSGGVKLSWKAGWDRDDSELTYKIYRNGTLLPDPPAGESKFWLLPSMSFTDTTTEPGTTYQYRIAVSDADGNTTAKSAAVSVTTPGTPTSSTVTRTPTADSYVNGSAVSSNYGPHQMLAVRGTSPYFSYLRFDLPEAPSGMTLKSAELTVRTSTDVNAASTDTFDVVPVTGSWQESTVTYTNRPSLSSTVLGTLKGMSQRNTEYSTGLSASGISGSLGGNLDIALTSSGTDSTWLWSRESSYDPVLTLTFGAA